MMSTSTAVAVCHSGEAINWGAKNNFKFFKIFTKKVMKRSFTFSMGSEIVHMYTTVATTIHNVCDGTQTHKTYVKLLVTKELQSSL